MSDTTDTPNPRPAPKAAAAAAQLATAQGTPAAAPPAAEAVERREDGRAAFEATDRAGRRVAGQLVPDDKIVWLSEPEAAAELLDGTIVPKGQKPHSMFEPQAAEPAKG